MLWAGRRGSMTVAGSNIPVERDTTTCHVRSTSKRKNSAPAKLRREVAQHTLNEVGVEVDAELIRNRE